MSTIVTIATYKQLKTAYFLKEKLEQDNIDCFFAKTRSSEGPWEEIRVQVKELDVEKSIRVILKIRDEYGKDIEAIEPANEVRKIIVPVDFSVGAEYACHYAIHMAQKIKGEIKVLHVYENPVNDLSVKETATYLDYLENTLAETEKRANARLLEFSHKMKVYMEALDIQDVRIHSSLAMGNILSRIKEITASYNPDFIVLGTMSSSGDSQGVFGGLADALIRGLNIPLCAVPGPCSRESFEKFNVLYATDFNDKDHTSLECLLDILEPFEKRVSCVHIDTGHRPAASERVDELNRQLENDYAGHDIHCMLIEDKNVFQGMKNFTETYSINLLSFTVHKRRIFEKLFKPNLLKKILERSGLPMLLFPS